MTTDDAWEWVRPEQLVTTQCSGWPCRYNSVLDFVFTAGPARDWRAESEIVVAAWRLSRRQHDQRPSARAGAHLAG